MNPFEHAVAQMMNAPKPKNRDGSRGGRTRQEQREIDHANNPNTLYPLGSGSGRAYANTREEMAHAAKLIEQGYTSKRIAELTNVRYNAVRVMKHRIFQGEAPFNVNGKFPEDKVKQNG